jgi:UDP-3-O-[3-hydroxymyristoyl] glucosamine N-acyltransferase
VNSKVLVLSPVFFISGLAAYTPNGPTGVNQINPRPIDARKSLTYIANSKYKLDLLNSNASAVILTKDLLDDCPTNALVVDNVYLAYYDSVSEWL